MTKQTLKNSALICLSLLTLASCATRVSKETTNTNSKFESIAFGDSANKVKSVWGRPETDKEFYNFEVITLNYSKPDGRPDVFFSIDSHSDRVIGKAQWIYSSGLADLEKVIKERFKNMPWQIYAPCHTRSSHDKILVNRDQGISVDEGGNGVGVVSWSTHALLSSRINLIVKTCPRSQPQAVRAQPQ